MASTCKRVQEIPNKLARMIAASSAMMASLEFRNNESRGAKDKRPNQIELFLYAQETTCCNSGMRSAA